MPFHKEIVENKGYTPYRTEWYIFDEEHELAGSVDMLYQVNGDPNNLVIYDWKRSCKLSKKKGFGGKTMKAPLDHLPDCSYWHYAMQLNIYRHILETKYNKTISGMVLVGVHPDLRGYEHEPVPILEEEVKSLFVGRKKEADSDAEE
jgi:hypothetical protein